MVRNYVPRKGDICWIHFKDSRGREQKGYRPALIISSHLYNERSELALVCPITSIRKDHPFEVSLKNTKTQGVVLVDHIKSFSFKSRKFSFVEKVGKSVTNEVSEKLISLVS